MNPGRICPGRYLALRMVYLVVACVLSVFDIGPVLDEDGNPRLPNPDYNSITIRYVSGPITAATVDCPTASLQVPQTIRMYHQASF